MIDIVIIVIFAACVLYDRYNFMQKTKTKVTKLQKAFETQAAILEKNYKELIDKKTAALDKIYEEAISSANLQMDEIKWEQTLLSACSEDVKHVETEFQGEMSMDRFNVELTSAAFYFFKSWQSRRALRPAVARIINLLQLFVMSSGPRPSSSADSKQFN